MVFRTNVQVVGNKLLILLYRYQNQEKTPQIHFHTDPLPSHPLYVNL